MYCFSSSVAPGFGGLPLKAEQVSMPPSGLLALKQPRASQQRQWPMIGFFFSFVNAKAGPPLAGWNRVGTVGDLREGSRGVRWCRVGRSSGRPFEC